MKNDLHTLIGANEKIMWQGKPNKCCFILESIFNPLLPIAVIWAILDFSLLGGSLTQNTSGELELFTVAFMLLHLMPVWIYLGGVLLSALRYKNTYYIVTDRGIYVSGGTFTYNYEMKPFTDLSHINIHRGIFDQLLGVGDVVSQCHHQTVSHSSRNVRQMGINISSISEYHQVFKLIKQLQTDIYADTMYPNDLRPRTNSGYNTEYTPDSKK